MATYYLLNEDTPTGSMGAYSEAAESLAEAHAADLEDSLPGGAEVGVLRERREEAVAADNAWHLAFSLRVSARARRDAADAQARAGYGRLHRLVKRLIQHAAGAEELAAALTGCPAPSSLTPFALVGAMERLAGGAARYGSAFASFGVTPASLAKLEGQRLALEQAIKDLLRANGALSQASFHRKDRKQAFLRQLRLVEGALQSDLPSEARLALRDARVRCLPRYSPPKPEPEPEPDEDGGGGGEPLPGAGGPGSLVKVSGRYPATPLTLPEQLHDLASDSPPIVRISTQDLDDGGFEAVEEPTEGSLESGFSFPGSSTFDVPSSREPYRFSMTFELALPEGWDPSIGEEYPALEQRGSAERSEAASFELWDGWSFTGTWGGVHYQGDMAPWGRSGQGRQRQTAFAARSSV